MMTTGAESASPASQATTARLQPAVPNLRVARFDDYPQIQRLESSHGLLTLSPRDWQSVWADNPLRDRLGEDWPIGWVLEDAQCRIVGSLANIPSLFTLNGQELVAATGRAWVVSAEYRGMALWLMDEYFNQNAVDLFINTTVNSLAVDPFTAFGSTRVPLGDWETAAYWITAYRGFARAALRIKNIPLPGVLAIPAAGLLRAKDSFSAKPFPRGGSSSDVAEAGSFGARFDQFWRTLLTQNPHKLLAVRDARTLAWHFGGPLRQGHVWILTASRSGLMRAYAILKRQDHPASGLTRMRLVDYQNLDSEDHLPVLLNVALQRARAQGIHTVEHVGCDLPKMRSFDAFAPYRRKLPSWPYYFKAADATIDAALRDRQAWDPSTFDGDASL